jgi:hypothetical protein
MGYTIYNLDTLKAVRVRTSNGGMGIYTQNWKTERSAKVRLTNHCKKNNLNCEDFAIVESSEYTKITGGDQMVERTCARTGKKFMERKDTPYYLSPSSETYWSQ